MGLSLGSVGRFLGNVAPIATNALAAKNDGDFSRALLLKQQQREQEKEDLAKALNTAQVNHLGAQAKSLDEGVWGPPVNGTDENGQPIMVQQHKQTGELRRATLSDPTPAQPTASPSPAPSSTPGAPPLPTSPTMAGVSDSQDMSGSDANGLPVPPQQPVAPRATAQAPAPKASGVIRPYVKPTNQRIDPLSPAGMVADSTRAAKVAQAQEPYKKDPNAAPNATFTPVTVTNPDGTVTVKPFNNRTGTTGESIGGPKAAAAAGGSASLSPDDRQKMLSQAKIDNETMKAYEKKVLAGQAKVGTMAGLAGASSDAHGGVLNNAIGILGNAATGAMDPEYQRYLTAQRSYGRIMGNLQSKRYTDHQAEIERSISGLQGNDLNGTISYKQQLRDASLADPVVGGAPAPAARTAPRGSTPTTKPAGKAPSKDYGIFTPGGDE